MGAVKNLQLLGLDPVTLLAGTDIRPEECRPDCETTEVVDGRLFLSVIENALQSSECPHLGLRYGEVADVTEYGPLGFAMLSAATDIEAVNLAIRFQKLYFGTLGRVSLLLENGHGIIRMEDFLPAGPARCFFVEKVLSGFLRFNRVMAGQPTRLKELRLAYADTGYRDHYEALFDCPVYFDREYHEVVFDTGILAMALPNANEATARACVSICEELMTQFERDEAVSLKVKRLLRQRGAELPDMKALARHLDCDERTLRRRLSAEQTSYREIKEELRRQTAVELLQQTTLTVAEIARHLGFVEPSNFRRAFRKWTGHYPGYFRRA